MHGVSSDVRVGVLRFDSYPGKPNLSASPPQPSSAGSAAYGPRTCLDHGLGCDGHCPLCIFIYKGAPPTNIAVQSVPVSTCRLLVVTKQTDGATFVGGCEANGGSA